MKIIYLLNQRFPTEKAYGWQVSKMCVNFMKNNEVDLELIYPHRKNLIKDDIFDYYGIKKNFAVKKVWAPDFYLPDPLDYIAFSIKSFLSAIILVATALSTKSDVIYSRDELLIYILSFFKKKLFFEAHKFSKLKMFMYRRFLRKNLKIITISELLSEDFKKVGFRGVNIIVAPDGVDKDFLEKQEKNPLSIDSARKILALSLNKKIAVYSGSLYRWKGVYTVADVAKRLNEVLFIFVGGDKRGDEDDFRYYIKKNNITNIKITGYIRSEEVVKTYLASADVLILPNTAEDKTSEKYTSPLKLFLYMASQRPIVASDLPSLREILNQKNSILVEADSAEALSEGIKKILDNSELSDQISKVAFENVKGYTWEKRSEEILKFLKYFSN